MATFAVKISHHPRGSVLRSRPTVGPAAKPLSFTSLAAPYPITLVESHPYKNHAGAGVRSLSCHSLHQEGFTTSLQSNGSTLFLKNGGVSPINSNSHFGSHPLHLRETTSHATNLKRRSSEVSLRTQRLCLGFPLPLSTVNCRLSTPPTCATLEDYTNSQFHDCPASISRDCRSPQRG
jgi:hypothetical protein